ncbi:MAG: sulfur carrier protein ThiS [Candidatus Methanomethylophilaceae archaeon]|nr:sulfur carrier protein ThiS [Candidatus Methanomethylophilaceae archaeon]
MELRINGEDKSIDASSLKDVVITMGLDPARVAVELNGRIVPRADFDNVSLKNGDSLEIVHFVGGG